MCGSVSGRYATNGSRRLGPGQFGPAISDPGQFDPRTNGTLRLGQHLLRIQNGILFKFINARSA